jgi:hypothetical protein
MEAQLFKKCRSHLKIPATRRVRRGQIYTENPQWRHRTKFIHPSDLVPRIRASWKITPKKSPKIKYNNHFRPKNFLRAKNDKKL